MTRLVVGAIIVDSLTDPSRVLAARRTQPAELAGSWEFPGGKVELGETAVAALVREVREELGVVIGVGEELRNERGADDTTGVWPISEKYELRLFFAQVSDGEPLPGSDHDEVRWLDADELDSLAWLPSDRQALPALRTALGGGPGR